MICILLLYCNIWSTAEESLSYYAINRTFNAKGVTIASQIRWVQYFQLYQNLQFKQLKLPNLCTLAINKIRFSINHPKFDLFNLKSHSYDYSSLSHFISWKLKPIQIEQKTYYELQFPKIYFNLDQICI